MKQPMIYSADEINEFLKKWASIDRLSADADLFEEHEITGDDFHEMIQEYAERFSVDMSRYLWYFHGDEEGYSIGGLFFTPPYEQVQRIPVTPGMLTDFVNGGQWDIDYPEHNPPNARYDLLLNKILIGLIFSGVVIWMILK